MVYFLPHTRIYYFYVIKDMSAYVSILDMSFIFRFSTRMSYKLTARCHCDPATRPSHRRNCCLYPARGRCYVVIWSATCAHEESRGVSNSRDAGASATTATTATSFSAAKLSFVYIGLSLAYYELSGNTKRQVALFQLKEYLSVNRVPWFVQVIRSHWKPSADVACINLVRPVNRLATRNLKSVW